MLQNILIKPASGLCNMRCDYCFYCDEMQKREQESYGFMSEETLKNVIRRTMVHAQRQVNYAYQGGEPALRVGSLLYAVRTFLKK